MTGAPAVRRIELCVAALVATSALLMGVVTLDAVRFHLPEWLSGTHRDVDAHTAGLLALLAVQGVVAWRAARSLVRQLRLERRRRRLPVLARRHVGPHDVAVVGGRRPRAFCAGLRTPRIYVTEGAWAALEPAELRAVVEHEASHVRRRDPLRLALARVVADGFGFVPQIRSLAARQLAVADLAADRAAVAALGSPRPLAAAMLKLDDPAPERLDHLLERPLAVAPPMLLAGALAALLGIAAVIVALMLAPSDPALPLALLPGLGVPALIAFGASREPGR
jgi:Zn-dependent protease with chaperone function